MVPSLIRRNSGTAAADTALSPPSSRQLRFRPAPQAIHLRAPSALAAPPLPARSYINGRPYVLRSHARPFDNLAQTGINRARLEEMEDRLRADVVAEAEAHEGRMLLHDENEAGEVVGREEVVGRGSVQTPREVYDGARARARACACGGAGAGASATSGSGGPGR